MRERPILFNGAMVRAILAGRKVQTRRAVKGIALDWLGKAQFTPEYVASPGNDLCPFGQPGDRLWVRESFRIGEDLGEDWEDGMDVGDRFPIYQADGEHGSYSVVPQNWEPPRNASEVHNSEGTAEHWRSFGPIPSIHMPRWACRLVLEITAVRVERLQAITEADAVAEGLSQSESGSWLPGPYDHPEWAFHQLWAQVYGEPSWEANPWVWVIEFKRVEAAGG